MKRSTISNAAIKDILQCKKKKKKIGIIGELTKVFCPH